MKNDGHCKKARAARSGNVFAWLLAAGLCLVGSVPAQALVVTVDLGWGWNSTSDTDLGQFALQEGSIVQIVMFNSATASQPGDTAAGNFDIFGDYVGDGLVGAPYTDSDPDHIPDPLSDGNTIYDPNSAPDGHLIAYTTEIGPAVGDNANGYDWYNLVAQFQVLGTYDSLYIRVFGTSSFPGNGTAFASYWGISTVQSNGGVIGTWYVMYDDVTATNHVNYFEVIPEPGTLALFALGGWGLWLGRRRRAARG